MPDNLTLEWTKLILSSMGGGILLVVGPPSICNDKLAFCTAAILTKTNRVMLNRL
jgi:hypothetical protein